MPLGGYGVLAGTLHAHFRDQPDSQGRWYHVNLQVDAPAGRYRCAIDVDSKQSQTGVQWKRLTLASPSFPALVAAADGYHDLPHNEASGALDYQRHGAFRHPSRCRLFSKRPPAWIRPLLDRLVRPHPWVTGSNLQAAAALETILVAGRRTFVVGEPFDSGLGMHNIHQNQGDPAGSQWWPENGIWQDGATLTLRPDGRLDIFISKFSSQSDSTDLNGHPI